MKIAIDAGHGYNTAGKRTPDGYREHAINVMCASFCEAALTRSGFDTVRIGWDDDISINDADLSLSKRQQLVKNTRCQISVSFHANAHGSGKEYTSANGVETLIHDKYPSDSAVLAKCVQNQLVKGTAQTNRGVKQQSLSMCNCKTMGTQASILVEIGFMTNKIEADLMKTQAFCKEQGEDVARGICEYLNKKYYEDEPKIEPLNKTSYKVRITASELNVRAYAGTGFKVTTTIKKGGVYTIVEEKSVSGVKWGKLKSGAGWISLKYTERV